jgi:hypothetical protein
VRRPTPFTTSSSSETASALVRVGRAGLTLLGPTQPSLHQATWARRATQSCDGGSGGWAVEASKLAANRHIRAAQGRTEGLAEWHWSHVSPLGAVGEQSPVVQFAVVEQDMRIRVCRDGALFGPMSGPAGAAGIRAGGAGRAATTAGSRGRGMPSRSRCAAGSTRTRRTAARRGRDPLAAHRLGDRRDTAWLRVYGRCARASETAVTAITSARARARPS